jgi:ribosomal subunit interface protein
MKINIKATGIELTPAISDYVYKKVQSVEKFAASTEGVVAQVEVGKITEHHKSGEVFRAEIHLVGNGLDTYAATEEEDLYAALDKVRDEIVQELTHKQGKKETLTRRGQRAMKGLVKQFPWGLKRFKFKGRNRKNDEL